MKELAFQNYIDIFFFLNLIVMKNYSHIIVQPSTKHVCLFLSLEKKKGEF